MFQALYNRMIGGVLNGYVRCRIIIPLNIICLLKTLNSLKILEFMRIETQVYTILIMLSRIFISEFLCDT